MMKRSSLWPLSPVETDMVEEDEEDAVSLEVSIFIFSMVGAGSAGTSALAIVKGCDSKGNFDTEGMVICAL